MNWQKCYTELLKIQNPDNMQICNQINNMRKLLGKLSIIQCPSPIVFSVLIIVHCTLFIEQSKAQSLESLVVEMNQRNPELKSLEYEYLIAAEKAPQVGQLPQPEASIGAFLLPVETRLGAQLVRLSASQMFPWFGTLQSKKDLEVTKSRAVFERIEAQALDLKFQLEIAYFKLYEIQKSKDIISRNIRILKSLEQLSLSKLESGKASAADVLRVQLKTEELEQELEILEVAKINPRATINQLLNRPLNTDITVSDSLQYIELPYLNDEFAFAIKANHPMFRMFSLQQEVSRKALSVNELEGKPSFGVGMDYIMVDGRSDAIPENNGRDIVQLRASVKIPIYRDKYNAKNREEKLKIEAIDFRKEELLSRYLSTIEKALADHEAARLKLDLYETQKSLTQSIINILETDYSTSGKNFDELLRLEKELIDYDLKILKAIVFSRQAKSSIDRFISNK
jgi:outer membrane protein TolC